MSSDRYVAGDYNIICQRTGLKIKRSEARKEWNGLIVDRRVYEDRHPQDFLRSRTDDQTVPDPRPEPTDRFLDTNEVTVDDL